MEHKVEFFYDDSLARWHAVATDKRGNETCKAYSGVRGDFRSAELGIQRALDARERARREE